MAKELTKKLGILISVLTFMLLHSSVSLFLVGKDDLLANKLYSLLLVVSALLMILSFYTIGKYVQVICLFFTSVLTLLSHSEFSYTIAQLILLAIIMQKYGFLDQNLRYKLLSIGFIFFILLGSIVCKDPMPIYYVITTIIMITIFVLFLFLIHKDNEREIKASKELLHYTIDGLKLSLQEKEEIIQSMDTEYINPVEAGLTKAELIVLENLCIYRESNADLAQRLNKSEHTIKNQLKKVLIKIGADNRYQLVDICKNYFLIFNL